MAYSTLAHPQLTAPIVGSVELAVPIGAPWTPTDWVTLESGIAESVLAGFALRPTVIGGFFDGISAAKVEIGVDDGSPRTIAAWMIFAASTLSLSGGDNGLYYPLSIGADDIPEGSDLIARISTNANGTFEHAYQIAASYLQKPLASAWLTSASPQFGLPDGAAAFTLNPGASYAESAPVVARASGPAAMLTSIAMWSNEATLGEIILDIYADDELVHTEFGYYGGGKFGLAYHRAFKSPLDAFPLDSEITLVARQDAAVPLACYAYLNMVAKPL